MKKIDIHRLNTVRETYVETIYALIKKNGYAVVTDIAILLNVKPSSVTEMLKKLDSLGFVKYIPYRNVILTKKGENLAVFLRQTQISLQNFFKLLDVDEHVAEEDACKIEHILHELTLERLSKFVEFVQNTPQGDNCIGCFRKYNGLKEYSLFDEQNRKQDCAYTLKNIE